MLALLTALTACSPGPVEATIEALEGGYDTGPPDTSLPEDTAPRDSTVPDSGGGLDTSLPEDTAPLDTAGPLDTSLPEDTGYAGTPVEGIALMELSYHLMHLGGLTLVDARAVLEDGTSFLTPGITACADAAPTFDEMVWLDYPDCEEAAGWGWVVPYSDCRAPGEGLYSGSLAFTFPRFAELAQDANPVDLEEALDLTLAEGDAADVLFHYSIDSGDATVLSACGTESGAVESASYDASVSLSEPGDFTMTGTIDAGVTLTAAGPSYEVAQSGALTVSIASADGTEAYIGRIRVAGLNHRADRGYPDAGTVGYVEPGGFLTGRVSFRAPTGPTGEAAYFAPDASDSIPASFIDLHD